MIYLKWKKKMNSLEITVKNLIRDMSPYLEHKEYCLCERGWGDGPCTCGLWPLIDKYETEVKGK
jgi:hypothetical protein